MIVTKEVIVYQTVDGDEPFSSWLNTLDRAARTRIKARINRLESGNLGDWRRVSLGVFEIRMHFGSGYRVYFGLDGQRIVILLCGGDKGTQQKDIRLVQMYLDDYKKR